MNQLSEILRTARAQKKLSQKEVGDKLGISQRAYAFYEDGKRVPKWSRLLEIGVILGIEKPRLMELYDQDVETNDSKTATSKVIAGNEREPTAMELLAGLTDGFRAIAETMRSIESKMAQESTQATINERTYHMAVSLQDVHGKVTTLWERQHMAIEEMREHFAQLGVQRIPASSDVHKKRGQNGGKS